MTTTESIPPPEDPRHVPWWPGRTDEVRRVADWLRRHDYYALTLGEIAGRTGTGVAIVQDAVYLNDCVDEAAETMI
jgi:hypothetical protein